MQIKLPNDTSLWARRLALYFIIYVGVIVIMHVVFSYSGFLHTDVDSARYMLSALIQSEAAIVALVVTLSLVAVQLAAQSYSARVIEVFRKTPDLWILMGIYGIAIFYGLGVLKMIENPLMGRRSNLEAQVSFAYYLGVFAFVALVPYIWNTLEMLKPSTVIDMLAEEITKENILFAIDEHQEKTNEKDPIQPIIDIVNGSIMKYDYETVRYGLEEIGNRCNHIFRNENFKGEEEKKVSEHIFSHLTRVGKLAVSKKDEDSTRQVITNLHKNGITAAEHELKEAVWETITSLRLIGISAAEKRLEVSTVKAAFSLGKIGEASVEKNIRIHSLEAGGWEASFLKEIGVKAAKCKIEHAVKMAIASLGVLGIEAAKHTLKNTTLIIISSIEVIGIEAAKQELEEARQSAIQFLHSINDNEEIEASDISKRKQEALSKLRQQ
jgi:hypothetical protein